MAKTKRRIVIQVAERQYAEKKMGDYVLHSNPHEVCFYWHPADREADYRWRRDIRAKEAFQDQLKDLLPPAHQVPAKVVSKLPVLGLWKPKTRRVRFFGPPQFKF